MAGSSGVGGEPQTAQTQEPGGTSGAVGPGLEIGDIVTWAKSDSDIPPGTKGKIVSFKESKGVVRAGVRFENGAAFNLKISELKKVASRAETPEKVKPQPPPALDSSTSGTGGVASSGGSTVASSGGSTGDSILSMTVQLSLDYEEWTLKP